MERQYGALELDLMRVLYKAWKVLADTDKDKYADAEFEFLDWLNSDLRATQTNEAIGRIWASSGY